MKSHKTNVKLPLFINKILENNLLIFRKKNYIMSFFDHFCKIFNEKNFSGKQKKLSKFLKKNLFYSIYHQIFMRKHLIFFTGFLLENHSNLSGKFLEFLSSLSFGTPYYPFLNFGINFPNIKKKKGGKGENVILRCGKFHTIFRNSIIKSADNRLLLHLHVSQILQKLKKKTNFKSILRRKICNFCPFKRTVNKITYKKAPILMIKVLSVSFIQKKNGLCSSVFKVFQKFLVKLLVFGEYFKKTWEWITFKYLSETTQLKKVLFLDNFFHSLVWRNQDLVYNNPLKIWSNLGLFKGFPLDLIFRVSTFFAKNSGIIIKGLLCKIIEMNLYIFSEKTIQNLKEFFLRISNVPKKSQKVLYFLKKPFSRKSKNKFLLIFIQNQNQTKRKKKLHIPPYRNSFFQFSNHFNKTKNNKTRSKDEIFFIRMKMLGDKIFQISKKKNKKFLLSGLTLNLFFGTRKVFKKKNFFKYKSRKYKDDKMSKKITISFLEIILRRDYKSETLKNEICLKKNSLSYSFLEFLIISPSFSRFLNLYEKKIFMKKKEILWNLNFGFYIFLDQSIIYSSLKILGGADNRNLKEKFFLVEWFKKKQKSDYFPKIYENSKKKLNLSFSSFEIFLSYTKRSKKTEEIKPQIKDRDIYKKLYYSKKKNFYPFFITSCQFIDLLEKTSIFPCSVRFTKKIFSQKFKKGFNDFIHFRNSKIIQNLKIKFIQFKALFKNKLQKPISPDFWVFLVFEYFALNFSKSYIELF